MLFNHIVATTTDISGVWIITQYNIALYAYQYKMYHRSGLLEVRAAFLCVEIIQHVDTSENYAIFAAFCQEIIVQPNHNHYETFAIRR